ncbi:unnamed protein product [Meloidogyne enterolobii]|uniref:Uncharacterized protein n=1 Tax=Meloidogyne enterolobii TaxID=390850 RepID=A0ACB0YNQ1_MELEN
MNNFNCVDFVRIKNKWKQISGRCCDKYCINTRTPIGCCILENGFINIINDENIKYINCLERKKHSNKEVYVDAENSFDKPQNCLKHSLYYFEVKCKYQKELNSGKVYMHIGLKHFNPIKFIYYSANTATIYNVKEEEFETDNISFKNEDIFGCGLVYPPINKFDKEFPHVFFTKNGKQIGKGVLLDNSDSYKPFVYLKCCSVDANFGNNLETKPFKYDISKHSILKEFY